MQAFPSPARYGRLELKLANKPGAGSLLYVANVGVFAATYLMQLPDAATHVSAPLYIPYSSQPRLHDFLQ